MKLLKRLSVLFAAVAAVAVLSVTAVSASADESEKTADIPAPVTQDDAGYYKYIDKIENSEAWGSYLTHQARFDTCQKIFGIDVSYYQGNIDWAKVKAAGINFVIIRAGYRGYGSAGTLVKDPKFDEYLAGAKAAGLKVGVYFYTQAITTAEAEAEAQYVLNMLGGKTLDMPIYYDIESVDYDKGRLDSAGLSVAAKTNLCKAFCNKILSAGYQTGVYANYYWLTNMIDGQALAKLYPIWLAQYASAASWTGPMEMWQYTGSGTVSGISNYTDMNVWYYGQRDLITMTATGSVTSAEKGTLTWSKPSSDAARYDVYRVNRDSTETRVASVTTLSATFQLRIYNLDYYVKIYNSSGAYLGASNKVKLQGGYITSLAVAWTTPTTIIENWAKFSDATGYVIYAKKADGSEPYTRRGYSYASMGYTITGLEPYTAYTVCIRPFLNPNDENEWTDSCFLGPVSNAVTVVTESGRLTSLKSVSTSANTVTLSWNALEQTSGYRVYMTADGSNNQYAAVGETTNNTFTVSGLTKDTAYKFYVRSVYGDVEGQTSNTVTATTHGVRGDVNSDGTVNASDLLLIKAHIKGVGKLTDAQKAIADVNGDGKVNSSDLLLIKSYIKGIIQL
ncbi:MAG: fibronectin type III domain-containing protein [Ruminococcus sp.]|nr:fibronectin type III domain-containing protein [Ruminococcus sp.]